MFLYFYYFCLQDSRTFSVTKYSMRILKKYPFRADVMLFFRLFVFFFFLHREKQHEEQNFFFPYIIDTYTHVNWWLKRKRETKPVPCFKYIVEAEQNAWNTEWAQYNFPSSSSLFPRLYFSIQCFYMTFAFEKAQKPLFPLVWFPSRFIDQSFRLIALVKSAKSSSICQYSWQSDWQWNCYFYGRSMLL